MNAEDAKNSLEGRSVNKQNRSLFADILRGFLVLTLPVFATACGSLLNEI